MDPHRYAHDGILRCAKAIREDLNRHRLLDQLLLGLSRNCSTSSSQQGADYSNLPGDSSSVSLNTWDQQQQQQSHHQQQQQQQEGKTSFAHTGAGSAVGAVPSAGGSAKHRALPDCRDWTLVITGHSLGKKTCVQMRARYLEQRGLLHRSSWCAHGCI